MVALAFLVLKRLQAPKARTTRLAITVWAAFGPYDTAEQAGDGLYRASRAVFGQDGITEHEEWIQGHIRNFHEFQAKGLLQRTQRIMRTSLLLTASGHAFEAACKEMKAEVVTKGLEAMEQLNKDLEKTGHRLEAVTQPDGTFQAVFKQFWSDEEIEKHQREVGEATFNAIDNGKHNYSQKSSLTVYLVHGWKEP